MIVVERAVYKYVTSLGSLYDAFVFFLLLYYYYIMFLLLFRFLSTQFVIHRESLYYYRPVLSLFSFGWLLQGFQGGWTVIKLYTANHHQKEVV